MSKRLYAVALWIEAEDSDQLPALSELAGAVDSILKRADADDTVSG